MGKTKTVLPMKGLRTPRIFLWILGFIHGKVLHTGGLDPETGTITSGYITGQSDVFPQNPLLKCITEGTC